MTVEGIPSRHEQCRNRGFDFACKLDAYDYHCEVLSCGYDATYRTLYKLILRWGVIDGTPCGTSKVCKNKKCVIDEGATRQCPEEKDLAYCKPKRFVPGDRIKTRTEQCQDHGFDVACKRSSNINCQKLSCGYTMWEGRYVRPHQQTLPFKVTPSIGTRCDAGKVCYKQKCMPVSTWPQSLGNLTYTGEETDLLCYSETY